MNQSIKLPMMNQDDLFAKQLALDGQTLARNGLTTLQLNLGKMCNLACHHCHVEAGPSRTEIMTWPVMQKVLDWLDQHGSQTGITVVDLTGGAPEMNPHFCELVEALTKRHIRVIDRCNLTILLEPKYTSLPDFLSKHKVEIVASLPCYLQENVEAQRGQGVYDQSIEAIKQLNLLGYGLPHSGLILDLVYNPSGLSLPPAQEDLQATYKKELNARFGIQFNQLYTITNMPIKRFSHALVRDRLYQTYMQKLVDAYHAKNVTNVMCRSLVSVGWQGSVYDCDFNQMLQMPIEPQHFSEADDEHHVEANSQKLWDYAPSDLIGRRIRTANHCFGCTAGAGSSCTGATQS